MSRDWHRNQTIARLSREVSGIDEALDVIVGRSRKLNLLRERVRLLERMLTMGLADPRPTKRDLSRRAQRKAAARKFKKSYTMSPFIQ